jgi:hypothetical protein
MPTYDILELFEEVKSLSNRVKKLESILSVLPDHNDDDVLPIETERFLTIRQFSELGLLSEYAIRQLVKQKKIPAIYRGKKALLPESRCIYAIRKIAELNIDA